MGILKKTDSAVIAAILALILLFSGFNCAKQEEETVPDYAGWKTYSYKHFVFHFSEDNYWGRNMDRFSNAYERYLTENCDYLAIEVPEDTIHFYIHDGPEAGKRLTGRELPFHTENEIHWDRMTPFGLELARFLIDKMGIRMTDFDFLYDGLAVLRDYSGNDYHHNTASLLELERLIPLDSLIDNESYARMNKKHREWEAASLVAFITYNFGINRFKMLWQSTATFEKSVQELFNMDLKTFEDKWLAFAMIRYQGVEKRTIKQDSTESE